MDVYLMSENLVSARGYDYIFVKVQQTNLEICFWGKSL